MKQLIVYAHPNPASFAHAILETLEETYKAQGHEVVVRDLYALGFDPVLTGNDFAAMKAGALPEDIQTEQAHITWADCITVVHPVWWGGLPAILKGYFDRLLLPGFAYSYGPEGIVGLLKGKKVIVVANHGNPAEYYEASQMYASMRRVEDGGIYEFCGLEVLEHIYNPSVPMVDDATRKGYLEAVKAKVLKHFAAAAV